MQSLGKRYFMGGVETDAAISDELCSRAAFSGVEYVVIDLAECYFGGDEAEIEAAKSGGL
jgi:hypothetical protein